MANDITCALLPPSIERGGWGLRVTAKCNVHGSTFIAYPTADGLEIRLLDATGALYKRHLWGWDEGKVLPDGR